MAEWVLWLMVNIVAVGFGYLVAPTLVPRTAKGNVHDDADLIGAMPVFALIAFFAFHNTFYSGATVHERWAGTSDASYAFLWLYVIRQIISFPLVFVGGMKASDKALMTMHHIASIIAYGGGLYTGRMHWFATLDGCCELTTIFLNFMLLFRALSYKGVLHTVNGITLWVTFLVFRLALFPYWLWKFGSDVHAHASESSAKVTMFELVFYPATTVMLLAMSVMWFISITKGMLKAMGVLKASAKQKAP
mmetsp:Transcript_132859/g.413073  ORF Transcript_132859/g.413073 Transcript_132859/m.413073 type:complete len:248 (+) Transcript_132859:72-815(+)